MTGTSGGNLSDKEIAEDLLTSKKYLSNYYYAPAILESSKEEVRSAFREVHSDVQQEAKEIFDYLNMRGWYNVRQADGQSINDLRNTANQSRQVVQNLSGSGQGSSMGSGSTGQWTGTQYGEGQSGMGPSSLSQGVSWGGQPSHMSAGIGAQSFGSGVYQGYSQQGNLPSWTRSSGLQGQQSSSHGISGGGWTGTQYGEGQSGMGPSSLSQGASWGGQPSQMNAGMGTQTFGSGVYQGYSQQTNLPSWTRGTGLQGNIGQQPGSFGQGLSNLGPGSQQYSQ